MGGAVGRKGGKMGSVKVMNNMGLMWERDGVYWGKRGRANRGEMLGRLAKRTKDAKTNFWDQIGVYALYRDFDLIYVGQAGTGESTLGTRLRAHTRGSLSARWNRFSWFGLRWVKGTDHTLADLAEKRAAQPAEVLDILEGVAIEIANPRLNRQRGRWKEDIELYVQVPHELSERKKLSLEQCIRELHEKVVGHPTTAAVDDNDDNDGDDVDDENEN